MNSPRPGGVTLVCVLAGVGAILGLVLAHRNLGDYETARWVEAHPVEARIEQLYYYLDAGITLLACYFMLQARGWARWLYLGWNLARFSAAIAITSIPALEERFGFLRWSGAMMVSAGLFVLALFLLSRAETREYFATGGKVVWRE